MKHPLTRPILHVLALLVLVSLLAPGAAAQRAPVPAPASGARLTAEQAIAVVMSSMEVGANDFRLSDMGQDNTYDAFSPAVAYNSTDNEYLVVWYGDDDDAGTVVDGEYEIYGQRVDAATGVEIGPEMRLSDMGPDGDPAYDAYNPAVAYNSTDNEYLVVWHGDDVGAALVDDRDVGVPGRGAGFLLRGELLVDLLRAGVARTSADRAHLDARILAFEAGPEEVVHVVDHVLVAGGDDVQRLCDRLRQRHCSKHADRGGKQHSGHAHGLSLPVRRGRRMARRLRCHLCERRARQLRAGPAHGGLLGCQWVDRADQRTGDRGQRRHHRDAAPVPRR